MATESPSADGPSLVPKGLSLPAGLRAVDLERLARIGEGRSALMRAARCLSPTRSVQACGTAPIPGEAITVWSDATVTGRATCSNGHQCPECAPRRARAKADELHDVASGYVRSGRGMVYGAALTIAHDEWTDCTWAVDVVLESWRAMWSGRSRSSLLASGIDGACRSLDFTWGSRGPHPHPHVLLFVRGDDDPQATRRVVSDWDGEEVVVTIPSAARVDAAWEAVIGQWEHEAGARGAYVSRALHYMEEARDVRDLARYVSKASKKALALETTGPEKRRGMSWPMLLELAWRSAREAAQTGDHWRWEVAAQLAGQYREYCDATRRRKRVTWVRRRFLEGIAESHVKEGPEIEPPEREVVATIPAGIWLAVVRAGCESEVPRAVADGHVTAGWRLACSLRWPWSTDLERIVIEYVKSWKSSSPPPCAAPRS